MFYTAKVQFLIAINSSALVRVHALCS